MNIRTALPEDAPRLAELQTAAYLGQFPASESQVRDRIASYLVAVQAGEVRAALIRSVPGDTAPGHLRLQLMGEPGDFAALYTHVLAHLPTGVTSIQSVVREDHAPQMAFLAAAGFRNAHQSWGAHLPLGAFDFGAFLVLEERLFMDGVEVERGADEADWTALHALFLEGLRDMPRNPTTTPDALCADAFRAQASRDQLFIARHRHIPVGFTWLSTHGHEVESEHTVTTAAWRGRGVATLTGARALAWAKEQTFRSASAGGTLLNLPLLRVNARLGYVVEPMWVTWVLTACDR